MVQPNMKKLIAYSSISHLGFVVLGIFSFTQAAWRRHVRMLAHGVSTGACSCWPASSTSGGTLMKSPNSAASPPRCRSIPHFSVSYCSPRSAATAEWFHRRVSGFDRRLPGESRLRILAATGVIWSACYMLWMYQRVFFGNSRTRVNQSFPDVNPAKSSPCAFAAWSALIMGVAPLI